MIIDTSALLAIMLNESERLDFIRAIKADESDRLISAASYVEAGLKLVALRRPDPIRVLDRAIDELGMQVAPLSLEQAQAAIDARERFGKGRHPAQLNYGDCIVYALSKVTGEPLLFKGDDFVHTDVTRVL